MIDIFYNTEELTYARSTEFCHSVVEIDFFLNLNCLELMPEALNFVIV